jgi:hypothetical protein
MQMTKGLYRALIAFLAAMLLIFVLAYSYEASNATKSSEALDDLQKELIHVKDKLGRTTTTAQVLELDRKQLLKVNAGKDSTLALLITALKEKPKARAVTVYRSVTTGNGSGKTETVKHVATDSTEFTGTIKRPDITATIRANKDSVYIDSYTVYTSYQLLERYERRGLFKKDLVIDIKPLNKNTVITEAKSWRKAERTRLTGLKVGLAVVAGFITGAYIL